jgi:hypothetical protein
MIAEITLLDVVALKVDQPAFGLSEGEVGTVVETLAPGVFEVEFSDDEGQTYALLALCDGDLRVLGREPSPPG